MRIILDEVKKEGVLIKKDGKEIARYTYKNLIDDSYTLDDFKKDLEGFNETLGMQEEFDNIKEMSTSINIHNWE